MHEHLLADRTGQLSGESAFQVLASAKKLEAQGKNILHFEIGEPDFPTAENIIAAGKKALDDGCTRYCPAQGLIPLREAIVEYTKIHKNIDSDIEEVVITPGGKPIIYYTISALVNPGDEVIYPNPGFPTYQSVINYVGGIPIPIALREENDFRLNVQELKAKISPRTKLLILNSPANPTGGILTDSDLEQIAEVIRGKEIFVLSDEIYSRIVYENSVKSIATIPGMKDWTIILDGFSKTYSMTGWRLGYGIMHRDIAEKVTQHLINSNSCTAHFVQIAGIEALKGPQDALEKMVGEFKRRRDIIVDGLNSIQGMKCKTPQGAFYAFPNVTGTGLKSSELADYLLQEAGVAVLDGGSFGSFGTGHLRFSYASSLESIYACLERIDAAMKKLNG